MLTFSRPSCITRYREATGRQGALPGVTAPSFICRRCNQSRRQAGRKQLVKGSSRHGYICAECAKNAPP